jgi:hypothetical protein
MVESASAVRVAVGGSILSDERSPDFRVVGIPEQR